MSEKLTRIYKKLDVTEIHKHLLLYGDLAGSCASCGKVDLKLDVRKCPQCEAEFKYISFRNIKSHIPKMYKLNDENPEIILVDYDDYKRNLAEHKAKEFLK